MGAAISVIEADDDRSSAVLVGTFDNTNRWFLTKHLRELDGDVIIDLQHVESLDDASISALREFCHRAAGEQRRVLFQWVTPEMWSALSGDD
jgi:anti-anti-sigma regulatory factor